MTQVQLPKVDSPAIVGFVGHSTYVLDGEQLNVDTIPARDRAILLGMLRYAIDRVEAADMRARAAAYMPTTPYPTGPAS